MNSYIVRAWRASKNLQVGKGRLFGILEYDNPLDPERWVKFQIVKDFHLK